MTPVGEVRCKKVGGVEGQCLFSDSIPLFIRLNSRPQRSYLAKVVGAYCKHHISYNTYIMVEHIS
jgi:hypothetical protein